MGIYFKIIFVIISEKVCKKHVIFLFDYEICASLEDNKKYVGEYLKMKLVRMSTNACKKYVGVYLNSSLVHLNQLFCFGCDKFHPNLVRLTFTSSSISKG